MKAMKFKEPAKADIHRYLAGAKGVILFLALLLAMSGQTRAATIDLGDLLDNASPGDIIALNASNTYTLGVYALYKSLTIDGNGATIEMNRGPLSLEKGGATLIIDDCLFVPGPEWPDPAPWGVLAARNGSTLIIRNSTLRGPGIPDPFDPPDVPRPSAGEETTAIFAGEASNLMVEDSHIENFTYGIQLWTGSQGEVRRCSLWRIYWGALILNNGSNALFTECKVDVSREDGVFSGKAQVLWRTASSMIAR